MRRETIDAALAGLGASLVIACGEEGGRGGVTAGSGIGSVGQSASASAETSGGEASGGSADDSGGSGSGEVGSTAASADDDDGPVFDLGIQPDVVMVPEMGCSKVDFLFVVDNSGSMGDN